jgi:hypothetical protein
MTVPLDLAIQKTALADWRDVLGAHGISGISFWCWYTNPDAGGPNDTDFTIQNKPAQTVLARPLFAF